MIIRVGVGRDGGGTVAELSLSSSTITVVGVGKEGGGGGDWRFRKSAISSPILEQKNAPIGSLPYVLHHGEASALSKPGDIVVKSAEFHELLQILS